MDFASINQGIISEESVFIDLKTEIDEILKNLVDPKLNEFRQEFLKTYSSLTNTFQNVSLSQRQINDFQEKLKRNLRNKNEMTKGGKKCDFLHVYNHFLFWAFMPHAF